MMESYNQRFVHSHGHSPVFKILFQTEVRTSSMASPPDLTNSAGMLSTPADFPIFSALTAAPPPPSSRIGRLFTWYMWAVKYCWISISLIVIPPQTVFVGGYTVFTLSIRPCVRPSVFLIVHNVFVSLVSLLAHSVIDRISPNVANSFVSTRQILTKGYGQFHELFPFVILNDFCIYALALLYLHNVDTLNICMNEFG